MERPFFPTESEARRELTRIGLIDKSHYHPQKYSLTYLMILTGNQELKKTRSFPIRPLQTLCFPTR